MGFPLFLRKRGCKQDLETADGSFLSKIASRLRAESK